MFIRRKTYDDIMQRLATLETQSRDNRRRMQVMESKHNELENSLDYWVSDYMESDMDNNPGFFRKAVGFVSNLHWHSPGIGPRR